MVKLIILLLALTSIGESNPQASQPIPLLLERIVPNVHSQTPANTAKDQQFKVPAEINLTIRVAEMPGYTNPKSFWEGSANLLVNDWAEIVKRTKAGESTAELGESLEKLSAPKRSLSDPANRSIRISIPVKGSLLTRLQQQPKEPQAFLVRSNIRIYDARLRKNFTLEITRIWQLKLFPDGEATIEIRIAPDSTHSIWGPVPKTLPPGYSLVPLPQAPLKKP
jgi:hypothetical protein